MNSDHPRETGRTSSVVHVFDELGDGVFRRRYDSLDLNVGVVIGDDGVLIVDTRSTLREARELREELRGLTSLPVRWVVNTHWHFDHTFGNAVFGDAEIWGHELCQIALEEHGEEMKSWAKGWLPEVHADVDEVVIAPPTKTFADRASLQIGRRIDMTYHGFGHTDNDIVVDVPDGGVIFFGDLIEEGGPPTFEDSYPVAWPLTLRLAADDLSPVVVPGHGDVVDDRFVRSQHDDLEIVADLATAYVTGELALEEAASSGPYDESVMRKALLRAQAVAR